MVVCVVVMCLCIVKLLWGQCMHAFYIILLFMCDAIVECVVDADIVCIVL